MHEYDTAFKIEDEVEEELVGAADEEVDEEPEVEEDEDDLAPIIDVEEEEI